MLDLSLRSEALVAENGDRLLPEVYGRLSTASFMLEVGAAMDPPRDATTWRGADLATAEGFGHAARRLGEDLEREHGRPPRRYLAPTLVLDEFAWCVAVALAGPYLAAGLLVEPAAHGVDVHVHGDLWTVRVRPVSIRTAAEPERDAAEEITGTFLRLLAPVVERAAEASGRRHQPMWRSAADMIAVGAWSAGEHLGDEQAGADLGAMLLSAARAPLNAGPGFRTVDVAGQPVLTRVRTECCFFYTLTAQACVTCPRTTDAERAERLASRS